jgi:hypothetical protein
VKTICLDSMGWDSTRPVNSTPVHRNGARTFLMKANSFFTELKRRKVYRMAAAYAVVSWLLIQAASIFLPTFDAPPCMMKAVVVLLVRQLETRARQEFVRGYLSGLIYARLGDKTKAIDYLKHEYLNHEYLRHKNIDSIGVSVDAVLDELQGNPQFEALAEKV